MVFLKSRFPALDSTDFCNGKVGTWASRGHGPLTHPLYPPLNELHVIVVLTFKSRHVSRISWLVYLSIFICSQDISLQCITMYNESRTTRHR